MENNKTAAQLTADLFACYQAEEEAKTARKNTFAAMLWAALSELAGKEVNKPIQVRIKPEALVSDNFLTVRGKTADGYLTVGKASAYDTEFSIVFYPAKKNGLRSAKTDYEFSIKVCKLPFGITFDSYAFHTLGKNETDLTAFLRKCFEFVSDFSG